MKKLLSMAAIVAAGLFSTTDAQIQKGNWMVGGDVANLKLTNGIDLNLTPKVGYFFENNWAVGGEVNLNVSSPEGSDDTQTDWHLGVFSRYYFSDSEVDNLLNNGKFFGEGTVGFGGNNSSAGDTTNGVNLGIGLGYSYFLTKNVGLEAILKYNGLVGGGNDNVDGNLFLGVGFQIFLPNSKAKAVLNEVR